MSRVTVACPACGESFRFAVHGKGKTRLCPHCGECIAAAVLRGEWLSMDIDTLNGIEIPLNAVIVAAENLLEFNCPACGHDSLDYGSVDFKEGIMYEDYICRKCGFSGKKVYEVFYTRDDNDDGEEIEAGDVLRW